MKKLLMFALPLVVFSGISQAASCSQNVTLATLIGLGSTGCSQGDKIFYNWGGSTQDATDTFQFLGPSGSSSSPFYTINLNAGTEGVFAGTFSYTYSIKIDSTSALIPAGTQGEITRVSGGIGDGGNTGSSATLTKNVTGGATCSLTVLDPGANPTAGNCTGLTATAPITIAETFSYTGTAGASSVTGVTNTLTQAFVSTTGVPEPTSMLLFGGGLLAVSFLGRKRFARK